MVRYCVRAVFGLPYVMVSLPFLHPNYQVSQVLRSDPTPFQPFAFLVSSTCTTYSIFRNWSLRQNQELKRVSLVTSMACGEARTGLRPRVSLCHSPCTATEGVALHVTDRFGRIQLPSFGAQYRSRLGTTPVRSSSLPFCVHFNKPITGNVATLDTGPLARSYPGGIRTRLSSKHCQFDTG